MKDTIPSSDVRKYKINKKEDSEWSYYFDFLYPNPEQMHWIQNRKVVDSLRSNGDSLQKPRRVDHWAYFNSEETQTDFTNTVQQLGFLIEEAKCEFENSSPYCVHFYRKDSVELSRIHDTVMSLVELSEQNKGLYDGWETLVVKS